MSLLLDFFLLGLLDGHLALHPFLLPFAALSEFGQRNNVTVLFLR
jgi:hypothetical protein